MNNNCEYVGGGYCLCSACQSMRETMESLSNMNTDEMFNREEVKKAFKEEVIAANNWIYEKAIYMTQIEIKKAQVRNQNQEDSL